MLNNSIDMLATSAISIGYSLNPLSSRSLISVYVSAANPIITCESFFAFASDNKMSGFLKETIERKVIDGAVNGTGKLVQYGARQIRLIQSGQVGYYILFMVLSLVLMIVLWFNDIAILRFLFKLTQK